jgi:hypothetical protein
VLVECGFVRAQVSDGREFSFTPSLARIAALGSPPEIVELFAALHGPTAVRAAMYVLAGLCEQDDPFDLIGYVGVGADGRTLERVPGLMPAAEMVILAQHLMLHGVSGKARPGRPVEGGAYRAEFDASEYTALARAHLGMSAADAEALSMTELQRLMDAKFPGKVAERDVPTREEYDAAMAALKGRSGG